MTIPACKRLRVSQVKPITLARYSESVQKFETWCEDNRKNIGPRKIDLTMTEYLHKLCEEGASILTARSTVYGYIMLRMSSDLPEKLLLNQSKNAIKGWVTRFPNHSKCGIDLRIWDVVARQCLKQGHELAAAAILLQGDYICSTTRITSPQTRGYSTTQQIKVQILGCGVWFTRTWVPYQDRSL